MDIVFGENSSELEVDLLREALQDMDISGTLYLGYPVLSTADAKVFVDALLVSASHGLVAFDLSFQPNMRIGNDEITKLEERQDQIYAVLYNKLNVYKDLRKGRSVAVQINVVSCHPALAAIGRREDVIACAPTEISNVMESFNRLPEELIRPLNAAIQRVSTLRPPNRREGVRQAKSRGAVLKIIENEIANLDQWQKKAAIESANGPQRIRGLAGSGKTVVLALKAAYLHVRHPEWKIAVTFQTRSLYQQFRDLVRRFTFEHDQNEPDWNNLRIMHAWGSQSSPGVYSTICERFKINPQNWRMANNKYGNRAFEGICKEINSIIEKHDEKEIFDVILVDEAQDFPSDFFRMIYRVIAPPHRIIWAYDDLQNLGDYVMCSEQELFGFDENGQPLVELKNRADKPREDIVLPVCYRNAPWALTVAHALGFGIYRREGPVQMFEEPSTWTRSGYERQRGNLRLGQNVTLRRAAASFPRYFEGLIDRDDAIICRTFSSNSKQYEALAEAVRADLDRDELESTDILIVLPNAYDFQKIGGAILRTLFANDVKAHLVGVTSSTDEVFQSGSVAITHIYRAKGNEAPMVYVLHSEYCQTGIELSRKRNMLFTAITRSKCWVRIFGVGDRMDGLCSEIEEVRSRNFEIEFDYPNADRIKRIAKVHRDLADEERSDLERKLGGVNEVLIAVIEGELPQEALSPEVLEKLAKLNGRK